MKPHTVRLALDLPIRQRRVLELIARSFTTKAIAIDLGISPKTVEYHRKALMDKTGIHNIPGLVRLAFRLGLIDLDEERSAPRF